MRSIKRIFVHCTAGNKRQIAESLLYFFHHVKGWNNPGYHYVVEYDGKVVQLAPEERVVNGVKGFNSTSISIAYTGGIDDKGKACDTRSNAQKKAMRELLEELRQRYPDAEILGHRDISPDTNHNGIVDPWERIKECPSFDAKKEYGDI